MPVPILKVNGKFKRFLTEPFRWDCQETKIIDLSLNIKVILQVSLNIKVKKIGKVPSKYSSKATSMVINTAKKYNIHFALIAFFAFQKSQLSQVFWLSLKKRGSRNQG